MPERGHRRLACGICETGGPPVPRSAAKTMQVENSRETVYCTVAIDAFPTSSIFLQSSGRPLIVNRIADVLPDRADHSPERGSRNPRITYLNPGETELEG